jgi:hypothetical protein
MFLSIALSLPLSPCALSLRCARAVAASNTPPKLLAPHQDAAVCTTCFKLWFLFVCGGGGGGWYSNTIACPNTLDAFGPCFPFFNVRTCFMRLVRVHAFGPCFPLFLLCRTAIHMETYLFGAVFCRFVGSFFRLLIFLSPSTYILCAMLLNPKP